MPIRQQFFLHLQKVLSGHFGRSALAGQLVLTEPSREHATAARVRGIPEWLVVWRHGLGDCKVPLVTIVALSDGPLLEGAVSTETVFAWPGLGRCITEPFVNAEMGLADHARDRRDRRGDRGPARADGRHGRRLSGWPGRLRGDAPHRRLLAFPRLVLALALAAALGPGIENAILAIAVTTWPPCARLARPETATICNSDCVAAAIVQGASTPHILLGHVVPSCRASAIVRLTLDRAGIVLTAAGPGFHGLGAQPWRPNGGDDRHRPTIRARPVTGRGHVGGRDLPRLARFRPPGQRAARRARPRAGGWPMAEAERPLVEVAGLRVRFPTHAGRSRRSKASPSR